MRASSFSKEFWKKLDVPISSKNFEKLGRGFLKSMNEVIIGLGSNIQPDRNIQKAKFILYTHFTVTAVSKFVTTTPIGPFTKNKYINGCVLIKTSDEMPKIKDQLKKIEKVLGREKTHDKFAPRTIDLDIIVWNKEVVDPDFYTRTYLKTAVLELIPDLKFEKAAIQKN